MDDIYTLTREENVFLAKKRWVESIYSGMRMENRNVTFPQTQTILEGINVADVSLADIQAILNMRDAWEYLLAHVDGTLNIKYLCELQKRVAYREALAWGELRTGSVGISGVTYTPPIPNPARVRRELADLLKAPLSKTEIALMLFTWITRSQLFWDGNKRTALLAANKILIENGLGILLVSDNRMVEFSALLSDYYETGNSAQLVSFLYHSCLLGLEYSPSEVSKSAPLKTSGPPSQKEKSLPMHPTRSSAWLKQARQINGITQKSLAEVIGVSTSAIANIEQRQRKGSNEVWAKIEQYFEEQ